MEEQRLGKAGSDGYEGTTADGVPKKVAGKVVGRGLGAKDRTVRFFPLNSKGLQHADAVSAVQTTTRAYCYQEDDRSQAYDVGRPKGKGGEQAASYEGRRVKAQGREEE
jgi:hypothetical protein